jgi:hypothetical protein
MGSHIDWSTLAAFDQNTKKVKDDLSQRLEDIPATLDGLLGDYFSLSGSTAAGGALRLKRPLNVVTSDNSYAGTTTDNYSEIWITPTTADRTYTFPDPTDAANDYRKIKIVNKGDGTYKVTVNPNASETINVMSGNEEWTLSSFELLQSGDWAEFISDGTNWIKCNAPYWHKIENPGTGNFDSETAWASGADDFSNGLTVDYSSIIPLGAVFAHVSGRITGTISATYYRAYNDANISNTPNADTEYSHILNTSNYGFFDATLELGSDRKMQFTVANAASDLYIHYPRGYIQ